MFGGDISIVPEDRFAFFWKTWDFSAKMSYSGGPFNNFFGKHGDLSAKNSRTWELAKKNVMGEKISIEPEDQFAFFGKQYKLCRKCESEKEI